MTRKYIMDDDDDDYNYGGGMSEEEFLYRAMDEQDDLYMEGYVEEYKYIDDVECDDYINCDNDEHFIKTNHRDYRCKNSNFG